MSVGRGTVAVLAIVVLVFATTILLQRGRFADNDDPTRYTVSLQRDPDRVSVRASFTLEDALLHSTHEGPDPKAYAPYLRNIRLRDGNGDALEITPCTSRDILACNLWKGWERGRKWRIAADPGTPVVLSYEVALEHDRAEWPAGLDSAAFRTEQGLFATGRALFLVNGRLRSPFVSANLAWMEGVLVPREDSRQGIHVAFDLPAGWRASAPWTATGENEFVADDLSDLSEAMIMLGTHEEIRTEHGGTALTLALGGDSILRDGRRLRLAFAEAHAYYTELFGGPPRTVRENPLERAIVVVNAHERPDGEVIGSNISVTLAEDRSVFEPSATGPDGALSLPLQILFHELFHLWNAMTFTTTADAEWFKEGVTDYHALRAVRQLGHIDEGTLFVLLGERYRYYLDARSESALSLTEAGRDEFGNRGLLYPGGLLAGLCMDLAIRTGTGNEKGLDDLLRRVYAEHGASGAAFGTATIRALAAELGGPGIDGFFEDYIEGSKAIPLPVCLGWAGLEAVFEGGELRVSGADDRDDLASAIARDVF